ncbi:MULTISPECIES: hypothetical protein [Brucella]|uniref:hypothetical protein n=1 Tax=Brucella TaxID=234 RepID=UPI0002D09116|nr:hypothetical protein C001_01035 [Brucella sp. F5/06]
MSIRFRLSEADCITLNGIDHVLEHYDELGVILRARDASSRRLSFSHEEIMQLLSQPDVRLGLVCIQGFPFVRNSDSRLLKENSREQTKPYR